MTTVLSKHEIDPAALFDSLKHELGFEDGNVTYYAEKNDEFVRLHISFPALPESKFTVYAKVAEERYNPSGILKQLKYEYYVNWSHTSGDFLCQTVAETFGRLCFDLGYAIAFAARKEDKA